MTEPGLDFEVRRDDWRQTRFVESSPPGDLPAGRVLFGVDHFAFTANNISYAKAGEMLRYWDFFPAADGWGRLPVMGFADVLASTHPDVRAGERVFGFFPMSRYLIVEPERAQDEAIVDGAAHRRGLAAAYNTYTRVTHDPGYSAAHEDRHMLMRGLFMTSYLAEDYIAEHGGFGAERFVIASASSKTAIALAFLVSRSVRARVVGLTSPRNAEFVRGLGCYDEVLEYDDLTLLDPSAPTVYVDMAGNGAVTNALHRHLGDAVRYSCSIGATHWDAAPRDADLPGATPEFFFAPAQIRKRSAEWGAQALQERIAKAWGEFRDWSEGWLVVRRGQGRPAVEQVYHDTLDGRTRPDEGHVLSLRVAG